MVELIVGIIIENVELLSKMEDMKVKERHIEVMICACMDIMQMSQYFYII